MQSSVFQTLCTISQHCIEQRCSLGFLFEACFIYILSHLIKLGFCNSISTIANVKYFSLFALLPSCKEFKKWYVLVVKKSYKFIYALIQSRFQNSLRSTVVECWCTATKAFCETEWCVMYCNFKLSSKIHSFYARKIS